VRILVNRLHAGPAAVERERVEELVQGHRGLDDIFAWGRIPAASRAPGERHQAG
jgi:hypothetical protein